MAKKENKAMAVVINARNELLKLDYNVIIDALEETTALIPSKWLMDILEMTYPKQMQEWMLSDSELYFDDLRTTITKEHDKQKQKAEKKPASEKTTTKSQPKAESKPKKAESKPKATKKTESKPKAEKPAKSDKKTLVTVPKTSDIKKQVVKRFTKDQLKKNTAQTLAIAYVLNCSIAKAKKTDSKAYYSNNQDRVNYNMTKKAIEELKSA